MVTYPQDWDDLTLGDLGSIKMCRRIFSHQTEKSGQIPFYKIGTFGKKADAYISRDLYDTYRSLYSYPRKGDVLISAAGTIGRTVVFDGKDAYFQDSNIVWLDTSDDEVDSAFLKYFYESYPWQNLEGTTIRRLYNSLILSTPISLPSLSEQKTIAETLSCMDEHIANLTELIEKKKGIRDGALEDLVSGRTRLKGFEKLKSNNIRIDTFLKVKRGKRLVRSQLSNYANSNAKVPVYQNSVVALGYYSSSNCCQQSVFVIAAGNAGDIGFSTVPFWAADDCYYFEPNEKIHQKYLYYCLLNKQQYIYSQTRRTSIPRLSHDVLERITILIPPIAEQKAIATVLTTMDDEIISLEEEKDKMLQIKAGAMDDLLTGRIRLTRQGG